MKRGKLRGRVGSFVLLCSLCVCLLGGLGGTARAGQNVRVGCVDIGHFLTLDEQGNLSGYGAEYLDRIAQFTGWEYTFVHGSWVQCLAWLKAGEIDLLLPAEYTPQRAEDFLFSQAECCLDYASLVGRRTDEHLYYEDFQAFDNIPVGMVRGNYLNTLFQDYARQHGFTFRAVYYDTGAQLGSALVNGTVDAIVSGNMEFTDTQKLLARIDYMPAYFITSRQNPALMDELNAALHKIFLGNPYYTAELHTKYYNTVDRQAVGFTRQEAEYIKGVGEITVLLEDNRPPLSWFDGSSGEAQGIYADILRGIQSASGLCFRFVPGDGTLPPQQAVAAGQAMVWGGAEQLHRGYSAPELADSVSYYDCGYSLVGKKERALNLADPLTISVPADELGLADLLRDHFPHWTLLPQKTAEDCITAVRRGTSELAAVNNWALSANENFLGGSLLILDSNSLYLPICLGVARDADPILLAVLNKAILKLDSHQIHEIAFNSLLSMKQSVSLAQLARQNPLFLLIASITTTVALVGGLFLIYRSRVQTKQTQLLLQKNRELAEAAALQEQLREQAQTDSLTGLRNKSAVECACQDRLDRQPEQTHAILVMDLDNFKDINDSYGHLYGDAVLQHFGLLLRQAAGEGDVVGRIGGDEFLMFLSEGGDRAAVEARIQRLYASLAQPMDHAQAALGCSIGVALGGGPDQRFTELFLAADRALYLAKRQGRNRCVFAQEQPPV